MGERPLQGLPAAPGRAGGATRRLAVAAGRADEVVPAPERPLEAKRAGEALSAAAAELEALAGRLSSVGRDAEAEIVLTGVLMAGDPGLAADVDRLVLEDGRPAAAALAAAAAHHADAIAGVGDATLAARADDVRSLGRRAARMASTEAADEPVAAAAGGAVLVAEDLGPADVAELGADVIAVALAGGAPTAHAAVVARGLGLPMAVGLGAELLEAAPGEPLVVDGDSGLVVLAPAQERLDAARGAVGERQRAQARAREERALPAITRDGRRVRVLVNAATVPEIEAGLEAGAEGVGLLRTELAFLSARAWPAEADHRRDVGPLLARLAGCTATIRVLDFGGDKTPPLLAGTRGRGIELLLAEPAALAAQLRAILLARRAASLRILLPVVESAGQVGAVRRALAAASEGIGGPPVPIGAMIETRAAVAAADEIAAAADFLSVGTNDLTHSVLGTDRFASVGAVAHDPRVLEAIAMVCEAARRAGSFVEVCGEAASERAMVPLLIGLGVAELSVGAARVGAVRGWIRELDGEVARAFAGAALQAAGPAEAAAIGCDALAQGGDAAGERLERSRRVVAVGPEV